MIESERNALKRSRRPQRRRWQQPNRRTPACGSLRLPPRPRARDSRVDGQRREAYPATCLHTEADLRAVLFIAPVPPRSQCRTSARGWARASEHASWDGGARAPTQVCKVSPRSAAGHGALPLSRLQPSHSLMLLSCPCGKPRDRAFRSHPPREWLTPRPTRARAVAVPASADLHGRVRPQEPH